MDRKVPSRLVSCAVAFVFIFFFGGPVRAASSAAPKALVAYFTGWGIYARQYGVRDLEASGSPSRITHINYAFATIGPDLRCAMADPWADIQKPATDKDSVDGVADPAEGPALRGNFNQLRKLKARHPNLKLLISIGGWTRSNKFSDAALTPESRKAFVKSCVDMFIKGEFAPDVEVPGVFDGIDIDWEYPAVCGNTCDMRPEDTQNFTALMAELRAQLDQAGQAAGVHYLSTFAAPTGQDKLAKIELGKVHPLVDFVNLMTYDFHIATEPTTNYQAALFEAPGNPDRAKKDWGDAAVASFLKAGAPASKLILGVPFYGRGWAGVAPGPRKDGLFQPAAGPAPGAFEEGIEDYKVLAARHAPKRVDKRAGALSTYDPVTKEMWTFDDAEVIRVKTSYIKKKKLGGAMIWELSGDDPKGTLIRALRDGMM